MQIAIVYLDIDVIPRDLFCASLCGVVEPNASVSRMQRYDKLNSRTLLRSLSLSASLSLSPSLSCTRKDTLSHKYEFEFRGKQREEKVSWAKELWRKV